MKKLKISKLLKDFRYLQKLALNTGDLARKATDRSPTDCPPDRPSALEAYQCKKAQSSGMATQMQLEVILTGSRIATRVL